MGLFLLEMPMKEFFYSSLLSAIEEDEWNTSCARMCLITSDIFCTFPTLLIMEDECLDTHELFQLLSFNG